MSSLNTKRCLLCHPGRVKKNDTLYWHRDPDTGEIWVYCVGVCQRGYSIHEYTARAGISLSEFLKQDFDLVDMPNNEVRKMHWPSNFVPMFDVRAKPGLEYIASRGIEPYHNMYYDIERKGIVFPFFFHDVFCGAQIRFIEEFVDTSGNVRKIDTLPGTRLGLLVYNWNQAPLPPHVKVVVVTEGAFNAIAIEQAFLKLHGSSTTLPVRCVALSGSNASRHHLDLLKELKDSGRKVILAPDYDEAGVKMFKKAAEVVTHVAFTNLEGKDWNDVAKDMSPSDFVSWFKTVTRKVQGG